MSEQLSITHAIQEISKGLILEQQCNCPPPQKKCKSREQDVDLGEPGMLTAFLVHVNVPTPH